jgi:2-polyprenyl-3-methyl-5-hydroxy-6-metoxy-1,4-benzoquinol methylase
VSAGAEPIIISLRGGEYAENRQCFACGADVVRSMSDLFDTRFGTSESYEVYRCSRCSLEQTSPVPSQLQLKQLYEREYNFGGQTDTFYTRMRGRFFSSRLYRLWVRLDGDVSFHLRTGSGRLLDIGCNEGRGLPIYAQNGFSVEGLELNENAAEVARRAGFTVQTCLLEELRPEELYDVAVLSNVLEHSLNPRQMLEAVFRVLDKGGQVWVSCPNARSWLRVAFGRSWINWHVPFHIFHFSTESLSQLLRDAGFTKIEIRQITPALWVAQSLIACVFARKGTKNRRLRSPLLTALLVLTARMVLFPILWLGNQRGRGDCLLVRGTKAR